MATDTEIKTPTEAQALAIESTAKQAERALVNQGDTVRASWRFSLDSVRSNISHLSPEAKDLLVWAFTWCIDPTHPIYFDVFSERIGVSPNTAYKFYSGKYKHPNGSLLDLSDKVLKSLRDFRRNELSRAKLGRKKFVTTPTAKKVWWACDQARKSQTPVMIYGASQVGKTEAFRQYCIDNNHGKSILIELEAVNGLQGLLKAIAQKLGISPKANTSDLIERIKRGLTPDMVLILDEVHLLANTYRRGSFFACMEQIRRLYDATQCGMVFSYTELGFADAEKERGRELMQIFRRGCHKVHLGSAPSKEDVKRIVEAFGLPWSDRADEIEVSKGLVDSPEAVLKQLAAQEGLKAIVERIRLANDLAADEQRDEITWKDFLTVHFVITRNAMAPATGW
jgi:DNA transposition AAA+ family ATPase